MPRITQDLLEAGSTLKKSTLETREAFLRRITHVSLVGKGIDCMENLNLCRNLTVLYLYDNNISCINGLDCCRNLQQLYLQNNNIMEITGLDVGLSALRVLHLHGNRISLVAGLNHLSALEQLKLDRQRLPKGESLQFDDECVAALAPSLKRLTLEGNHLRDVTTLQQLRELEEVDLAENEIDDIEQLALLVSECTFMASLNILGNPVCKKSPAKLRQRLIVASPSLVSLNDKPIPDVEREFALNLTQHQRLLQRRKSSRSTTIAASNGADLSSGLDVAAADLKPVPHLPPYATQYRDLLLQKRAAAAAAGSIGAATGGGHGQLQNVAALQMVPAAAASAAETQEQLSTSEEKNRP